MRADFRAFFQQGDSDFLAGLGRLLLQTDRRRQTRRSAAHDNHVIFHGLALDHRCVRALWGIGHETLTPEVGIMPFNTSSCAGASVLL